MHPRRYSTLGLVLVWLVSASCAEGAGAPAASLSRHFAVEVTHAYFPLQRGVHRSYAGEIDGVPVREEVRTLAQTRQILGVACTAVEQELYLADELTEVTTEWYAQDSEGNVWKFGEEGQIEGAGGGFVVTADSWLAGSGDAQAWIAFAAAPQVGDRWSGYAGAATDEFVVTAIDQSIAVAAGAFADCLAIEENPDEPLDADIILYAPRVGRVLESSRNTKLELVSVRGN